MLEIQNQKDYLRSLLDHQSLEFFEGLSTLLKSMYRMNFSDIAPIIEEFQEDILNNGVFYIDILNDQFLFLLKRINPLPPLQINLFLLIMESILPIANRKTRRLLDFFARKVKRKYPEVRMQVQGYKKVIDNHLNSVEKQMKSLFLHPYKDILPEYYP